MPQRDLLRDEIEQLGKVLGKILADFIGLKSDGMATRGMEIANQRLQSELDIDIKRLLALSDVELIDYLQQRKLTAEHLEILCEYLKEMSEAERSKEKAKICLVKAMELLDAADVISKTLSFDRINRKKELETLLQQTLG